MKLRIFYVYYHSYEDMPIHVSDVIEEFACQGDEVHLFTSVKRSVLESCPWREQIQITNFPGITRGLFNRMCYSLLLGFCLPFFCLLKRPMVIYERSSISALITVLVAKCLRIPYACEVNGIVGDELRMGGEAGWRITVTRIWESLLYSTSDLIIAVTDPIRDWLVDFYRVPADRIEVVSNGTNIHRFHSVPPETARESFHLPQDGSFYVGYLGTLTPWCGVELLIECAPKVLRRLPQVRFLIGGGQEPYLREFKELAKSKGLQHRFLFFGSIPWVEAARFISSFDLAVISIQPLRSGASPQKLFSYLACDRPVIGSDMGMVGEILRRYELGLTFTPGSADSLAEKIIELLTDQKRRDAISGRARQVILDHFSWAVKVKQIKEAFRKHAMI